MGWGAARRLQDCAARPSLLAWCDEVTVDFPQSAVILCYKDASYASAAPDPAVAVPGRSVCLASGSARLPGTFTAVRPAGWARAGATTAYGSRARHSRLPPAADAAGSGRRRRRRGADQGAEAEKVSESCGGADHEGQEAAPGVRHSPCVAFRADHNLPLACAVLCAR